MATGFPRGAAPGADGPGVLGGALRQPPAQQAAGWTAGRVIAVVAGSVLALLSLGLLGGGGTSLWAGQTPMRASPPRGWRGWRPS